MNSPTTTPSSMPNEAFEITIENGKAQDCNVSKDRKTISKNTRSFITLEVHYARGQNGVKSAKPYFREAVSVDSNSSEKFTFRSFLRHGIFEKRPELKYRDNDVVFFQTPKGTNLLSMMDEPIDSLSDLLSAREQKLLKIIILGKKSVKAKLDPKLSYTDPNIHVPAWPKTRLEGNIPEDESIQDWITRPFMLDAWKDPKKRRKLIIIICLALLMFTVLCSTLGVVFARKKDTGISDNSDFIRPTNNPTLPPTPLSKFDKLRDIASQITDQKNLDNFRSPQRLALNWIVHEDEADLGSNLCFQGEAEESLVDDLFFYYDDRRHRKLNSCNDNERVLQRYALAIFYFSTIITNIDTEESTGDDGVYYGDFGGGRRKLLWIDDLNFLTKDHECSWHRNFTEEEGIEISTQGVICKDELDGSILRDESTNMTVGTISLHINKPNELIGSLPASLFQINKLQEIILPNNELSGEISVVFSNESMIEHFEISSNNFTGTINFLSSLPSLKEARLNDNMLSGKIPSSIGQLKSLRVLTLGGNNFTGPMPDEICQLRREHNLESLVADCGGAEPKVDCDCCTSCHVD